MSKQPFAVGDNQYQGYLALPPAGRGPGLLLLHAWWGLTDFFMALADKLAAEGFVVFAPDLFDGAQTDQIAEAEQLVTAAEEDFEAVKAKAQAGLDYLQSRPEVSAGKPAVVGFSFGAAYAYFLDKGLPDAFGKVVLFYGMAGVDVSQSAAQYLAHFAENDPYESTEEPRLCRRPTWSVTSTRAPGIGSSRTTARMRLMRRRPNWPGRARWRS